MSQQSIDCYFGQRKRKAGIDEIPTSSSKVIILEDNGYGSKSIPDDAHTPNPSPAINGVKLISNKKDTLAFDSKYLDLKCAKSRGRAVIKLSFDNVKVGSINNSLKKVIANQIESKNPDGSSSGKNVVQFKKAGALSPKKRNIAKHMDIATYMMTQKSSTPARVDVDSNQNNVPVVKRIDKVASARKELSLGDIKKVVSDSGRINELRASLARFNKGSEKLKELELKKKHVAPQVSALKEFKSIDVIVPGSPVKQSPLKVFQPFASSPVKEPLMSPRKEPTPVKSPKKVPAYLRLESLAAPKPTLTLPHHYRWLGEVFRGVETVVAMLHNRKETVTFSKIKPAVQEMLRRNISESHLSQIKHICPQMYTFGREKVKNFGATARREEYELVLTPHLVSQITGSPNDTMSPALILERRRAFYNLLLDKVKDHHAAFLISLDPPMDISKDKLKRWHPNFDIENIPGVETDPLPQPPDVQRYSTAQDVLTHLKEKFNCNTRMEKALQKLADAKARGLTDAEQVVTGLKSDSTVTSSNASQQTDGVVNESSTSREIPLLNPALKGLPKALLDRVRAKQAAKALELMSRTPTQEKNAAVYGRLPDLARVLRLVFVTEKKSVMPLDTVLSKLNNSLRSKMSNSDLTAHLRLLGREAPAWMMFYEFGKVEHVKIMKDADMSKLISKLEELAGKHSI